LAKNAFVGAWSGEEGALAAKGEAGGREASGMPRREGNFSRDKGII
jgi:hypothetical protein